MQYIEDEENKNALVVQSNKLINGRYEMSLVERRIFLKMVSMIKTTDKDFQTIFIDARDIIKDMNLQGESAFSELKKATKRLIQHVCEILEPDGLLQIGLVSSAKYHKGKGLIELSFDPKLKPYLLQLKNNFTMYGLKQALQFKSLYSLRIYELLKQFSSTGYRIILLSDLRQALNIKDEYKLYADFKRFVLMQAHKELKDSDIPFEFEEIKTGKKVTKIKFTFEKKTQPETLELVGIEHRSKAYEALLRLKLTEYQAKQVLSKTDDLSIFQALYEINIAILDNKIRNKSAYAFSVLKGKFGLD
jgi:plasmid replication initiation protein